MSDPVDRDMTVLYRNHRGETAHRRVRPLRIRFGTSPPWHLEDEWLLEVYDHDKKDRRTFALCDVIRFDARETP